jgi:RNA-directed DNA polymerase
MQFDEAHARGSETDAEDGGQYPPSAALGAEQGTATIERTKASARSMMEAIVERGNVRLAYQRVIENKGAAGIDGLRVDELKDWLKGNWPTVRVALLTGSYLPQPVRAVEIAKPNGGSRLLGIPTVVDRLIQQAMLQVIGPLYEPHFSESSYGFRPGRSALKAVKAAQGYIRSGKRFVVDMDIEKFFDRVNHDILMSKVSYRVTDERVLKLIRRYLEAGMMRDGLTRQRTVGTPQGGPLSPLLSNILLDTLDRELTRRGHCFCRYADDCNIYVASQAAAEHALHSLTKFLKEQLKLEVNRVKSACARSWERKFLGYSFTRHKQAKLKIAATSLKRLHETVRECCRIGRGRRLTTTINELNLKLRGWMSYFRKTEVKGVLDELDGWIRRKLRCLLWQQWKRPFTRAKALMKRGLSQRTAWLSATNGRGAWWNAGASHMNTLFAKAYFDRLGLVSLMDSHRRWQLLA